MFLTSHMIFSTF